MKKIFYVATMAITAATFVSCGNSVPKAELNDDVDTLSYAFGIEQSQGVKQFLQQMEIDTAYIDEFAKGIAEAAQGVDDKKKAAYNAGIGVGQQLNMMLKGYSRQLFDGDSTKTLSMKNLAAGFIAGATGKDAKMTLEQARMFGQAKAQAIQTKNAETKFAKEKKASDDFMAAATKKEGIQKLGLGVLYKVLKAGNGAVPSKNATVTINYEGKNISGKVFDKRDGAKMPISGAIPGFVEAISHMPVGSKWEIYIPYSAGYGAQQAGPDLKPFSALIFTVELLKAEESSQAGAPQIQQ